MTNGDKKVRFTEIYNQESDSLFRFCLFRVSDREKALDLTQEAFTRLWTYIYRGKKISNPRALLYKVARNLIIDWYRKVKPISIEGLANGDGEPEFDPPDPKADLEIELGVEGRRVLSTLNKLHPHHKEVIYLRYIEGIPPRDVAEILGLNANTVSLRISRGMEALRKLMGIDINKHE